MIGCLITKFAQKSVPRKFRTTSTQFCVQSITDILTWETPTTNNEPNAVIGRSPQGLSATILVKTTMLQHSHDVSQY